MTHYQLKNIIRDHQHPVFIPAWIPTVSKPSVKDLKARIDLCMIKDRFRFQRELRGKYSRANLSDRIERSIELARAHLDFFAFTGHASWHDMPRMPGDRHLKWVRGFAAHSKHWLKTRRLITEANSGDFVAILGYEWHSSEFGDHCMRLPRDQAEL